MSDFTRGKDIQIQVVEHDEQGNASVALLGSPVSGSFSMDTQEERDDRLGEAEGDPSQIYEGDSGSLTFKNDSATLHNIQMKIRNAARTRSKTPKFQIIRTVWFPEIQSSKTLMYPGCTFKFSEDAGGKSDAFQTTIEWSSRFAIEI